MSKCGIGCHVQQSTITPLPGLSLSPGLDDTTMLNPLVLVGTLVGDSVPLWGWMWSPSTWLVVSKTTLMDWVSGVLPLLENQVSSWLFLPSCTLWTKHTLRRLAVGIKRSTPPSPRLCKYLTCHLSLHFDRSLANHQPSTQILLTTHYLYIHSGQGQFPSHERLGFELTASNTTILLLRIVQLITFLKLDLPCRDKKKV